MMIDGRNRLMWMLLVLGILVAAFLPLTASSGEEGKTVSFERMLPKTTHFFLSFKNPAGQKEFKNSALGKIRHEPEMEAFCKNAQEQFAALAAEQTQNNNFPTALLREV
ncbi:MAG: hypothetical protein KGZ25_12290, partial [Planctomycetes bacterium]|nr:hypothetical protein [Planctomycetota bacterium]